MSTTTRILAVDPMHGGFGYAVFDLPFQLESWGRSYLKAKNPVRLIERFDELLDKHKPDVFVFEDVAAPGSKRRQRASKELLTMENHARDRGLEIQPVSRLSVLRRFAPDGSHITKYDVAGILAKQFPSLARELPSKHPIWKTEQDIMAVFDALAFAVTFATS